MAVYKCFVQITDVGSAVRLVEAKTEATALKFVSKSHIHITRPTSAELVALGASGVEIERAEK